jgi:hypothetical protein
MLNKISVKNYMSYKSLDGVSKELPIAVSNLHLLTLRIADSSSRTPSAFHPFRGFCVHSQLSISVVEGNDALDVSG